MAILYRTAATQAKHDLSYQVDGIGYSKRIHLPSPRKARVQFNRSRRDCFKDAILACINWDPETALGFTHAHNLHCTAGLLARSRVENQR